jgi:hypothetical protein
MRDDGESMCGVVLAGARGGVDRAESLCPSVLEVQKDALRHRRSRRIEVACLGEDLVETGMVVAMSLNDARAKTVG